MPTLKRIAYWVSTFTIPIKPFAESTGGYMYKIYVNGGNPGELGVYLITGSLVTDIKAHSKVSYTVNEGTSVVFNATSTIVAYYELIKFPST